MNTFQVFSYFLHIIILATPCSFYINVYDKRYILILKELNWLAFLNLSDKFAIWKFERLNYPILSRIEMLVYWNSHILLCDTFLQYFHFPFMLCVEKTSKQGHNRQRFVIGFGTSKIIFHAFILFYFCFI
jgi:hypothetical protein